jgi:hypothetical protein
VFPGADERTPSRAQYFSWINNTNEGATEAQTLTNLQFFRWLRDEYGLQLDIYAFDAGAIDGAGFYGSTDSERFKRQFPRGFGPCYEAAKASGIRLGVWGGPDGFGDTPEEEKARTELMVSLCRDYEFALFKIDSVCGQLREEKQEAWARQMTECRTHSPDLILLNHRLNLGIALPHATTFLWEGAETYIDVHMVNKETATHNRACALARGLPPDLQRLTEDHGVCLSSCLDYWDDDLVLQAFNRSLILAPEVYGNPWLLADREFPRFARIFNLHRAYRDILVDGLLLPEDRYGATAVARGDGSTRVLTLRNLTWEPVTRTVALDESIGLTARSGVRVRRLHPHERALGEFEYGATVDVEVLPFRACMIAIEATDAPSRAGVGVTGCDFDVTRDVAGKPVEIALLGLPGTSAEVRLDAPGRTFARAALDGEDASGFVAGEVVRVEFGGEAFDGAWHRKLGDLAPVDVPDDAEALYEATCFAGDNNALEVRELERSGPTDVPEVRRARDAFFSQPVFGRRHLWDRHVFDDDPETAFAVNRRWFVDRRIRHGAFRLDLGAPTEIDRLVLEVGDDYRLQPLKSEEVVRGAVSADLKTWTPVRFYATEDVEGEIPAGTPVRYVRIDRCPDRIAHVRGYRGGKALDRTGWRVSNLFASYRSAPATQAFSISFTLPRAAAGGYLAIPIAGEHGAELAYAALRAADGYVGSPRRSPSYPSNTWECPARATNGNYTYYVPVTPDMVLRELQAVVLLLKGANADVKPEVWLTAYPVPFVSRTLVLE